MLPLAKQTTGQLEKETLKKRIPNIEQGIMNVDGMRSTRREPQGLATGSNDRSYKND